MAASPARHVSATARPQTTRRRAAPVPLEPSDGEVLRGQALLDDAELWELSGGDGLVKVHPGTLLLSEGDPVESLFLIQSGQVEVYRRARGRRLVMQILRPGDLVGLVPHLCGRPAHYNARAISP